MRNALVLVLVAAFGCRHAPARPGSARADAAAAAGGPGTPAGPQPEPLVAAAALSEELHALLRAEGQLLWKRWTTGAGALPSSALAEHPRLETRDSLDALSAALGRAADGPDRAALQLLHDRVASLALARLSSAETDALDRARAALSFAAPGEADHGERELDRLLTDEPSSQKRAAIALAEAKAARALWPLAVARDEAIEASLKRLGLGTWQELQERAHGMKLAELAALAEQTLSSTEAVAARAVAEAAQRNLGVTVDRLRRADLPRMVRAASADASFPGGHALIAAKSTLGALGGVAVDSEPSPSKGARPLALLVDPPSDVRLSLRPAGGYEEQRATLHEAARARGATLVEAPRWELAQLGDGAAAEGAAQLYEELAGDPAWLREQAELRGDPLDELVHTQATRRLLAARRAAALVLFEIRRHEAGATPAGPAEAAAALYRGLVQRATFSVLSDEDAARWALEADPFLRAATQLTAALLAAQLEQALRAGAGPGAKAAAAGGPASATEPAADGHWWHAEPATVRALWTRGRSATALDAARALGAAALDPAALAAVADLRLSYKAPEAPPPAARPDYKFMQGDKRTRKRKHKRK